MIVYTSMVEAMLALLDIFKKLNPDLITEYEYHSSSEVPNVLVATITLLTDHNTSIPTSIALKFSIWNDTIQVTTVTNTDAQYYVQSSSQMMWFARVMMQVYPIPNNRKESLMLSTLTTYEAECIREFVSELSSNITVK